MSLEITLQPELGKFVEEKVRSGEFASPSDVVGIALSILKEQDSFADEELPELREKVQAAIKEIEDGKCAPWDPNEIRMKIAALGNNH